MLANITAQDLLIANAQICSVLNTEVKLVNPALLTETEFQLKTNLNWFKLNEVAAYVGIQIAKKQPFAQANVATAVALVMALMGLKTKEDMQKVVQCLSASSVVDEIASELSSI